MRAHEAFHPLPARESISAGWLYEMVEGKGTDDEWPNDGESLALRLASAYPDEVAQALAAGARLQGDENVELATWCVRCLVRMQRWDPAILRGVEDEFPWYHLKVAFGDAGLTGEQWSACRAALRGGADYREIEPASAGWRDRVLGRFCALTGDSSGLPQRLDHFLQFTSDYAWQTLADKGNVQLIIELIEVMLAAGQDELLPIHVVGEASPEQAAWLRRLAPRSYAAAAALSEIGDLSMRESLFWGVDAGVDAAHYAMDMCQAEVAWRSGCMVRLLERALEHGSNWPFWAKFWIAEEMRSYLDLDTPEFAQKLRCVLASATGVDAARSPFTGGWGLVPRFEGGR
ncbi:MAG: hypothetical protein KC492_36430 [Myxococcales bacterium]|nr:hypothetical protein [Myxococcales bacterium]